LADVVIATDIYGSREAPIQGVTGQLIVDALKRRGAREVHYIPDKSELPLKVAALLEPGDLIVTLGAGDIGRIGRQIFETGEKSP
jgi:UDP-N-acetylmuramate--alanine ligase